MMERYIFTFTAVIILLNMLSWIMALAGHKWTWPKLGEHISPTSYLFIYPSMLWQMYYWSEFIMM